MKILTIVGTRPELIRLSRIISLLDQYVEHIFVHTGQNYDQNLKDIFLKELCIRDPDYCFDSKSDSFSEQIAKIFINTEKIFRKEKPDKILILGDTNSALSSFVAKRLGIPVYHMEAGNRCFDDKVPEEVNRKVIDHCSTILMPYTNRSKENLIREGIDPKNIYVIGNPIYEVIEYYVNKEDVCYIKVPIKIEREKYFLVTLHREENVDNINRLNILLKALDKIQKFYNYPVLFSMHPRTRKRIIDNKIDINNPNIYIMDPLKFSDFVNLELNAFCILTDSGTVQEECCIYNRPCVTLRDTTERPETVEVGSNIISGYIEENIINDVSIAVNKSSIWKAPPEYKVNNVSSTVLNILLSTI